MASLVYLTSRSNSRLADDLVFAGHKVFQALAVSEALYLCEHERIDVIVIAPDIEDPDFAEAQLRYITMRMKPGASVKDLIWELSRMFPDRPLTIQ